MPSQAKEIHRMNIPAILRKPTVVEVTGLSAATIDRRVRVGLFPQPIRLGPNSIGWRSPDIEAWVKSRPVAHAHRATET